MVGQVDGKKLYRLKFSIIHHYGRYVCKRRTESRSLIHVFCTRIRNTTKRWKMLISPTIVTTPHTFDLNFLQLYKLLLFCLFLNWRVNERSFVEFRLFSVLAGKKEMEQKNLETYSAYLHVYSFDHTLLPLLFQVTSYRIGAFNTSTRSIKLHVEEKWIGTIS